MRLIQLFILLIIFWACSTTLQAQIKYGLRIADSGRPENFYCAAPVEDGFLIQSQVFYGPEPFCLQIEKIDWKGNFVSHHLDCYENYIPAHFATTTLENSNVFFASYHYNNDETGDPFYGIYSKDGDLLNTTNLTGYPGKRELFYSIVKLENGFFLNGGNAVNAFFSNLNPYFVKLNNNLDFEYDVIYDYEMPVYTRDVAIDYDGNLLITAYEWLGEFDDGVFNGEIVNYFDDLLLKVDPATGDTIWTKYNVLAPEDSKHTSDINGWFIQPYWGGYLTAGTHHVPNNDLPFSNSFVHYHTWKLAFLNQDFEEQWSVNIQDSIEYDFEKPILLNDGNILMGGVGRYFYSYSGDYPQFIFLKYSPDGELIWRKQYWLAVNGDREDISVYNTAEFWEHPEGGYVLTGPIRYGIYDEDGEYIDNRNVYSMWIDENGCINQGQCADPILQIEIPPANNLVHLPVDEITATDIQIFPNPVNHRVNIALPASLNGKDYSITLFDGLGRKVWEAKSKQLDYSIDVSQFPSGIYHVQLLLQNIDVAHSKLVITK